MDGGARPMVLRRPPLGHVLRTAHDMAREFRIIQALAGTDVPVPAAYVLVDDADGTAGVGTDFYLMELVEGRILRAASDNAGYDPETLRGLGFRLVETLAALHAIDPADVGLADFGRPDGYLARQVRRWGQQYDGSRSRDVPELDRLLERIANDIPETRFTSLLHGDFRLDNVLVAHDAGGRASVAAILDWEMATIGDSLADLGLLGLYWNLAEVGLGSPDLGLTAIDPAVGYPEFDELCARYAELRGIRLPSLSWYLAFAALKLAIILEGIHYRHEAGETLGPGFDGIGNLVAPLARYGLRALEEDA
ncbi:phosphotransferase family protein [Agromyces mangrovi Wang et al. 2018]|uniref:phosphotransferase family protein n=1 Tax=Agromyces mangrovi TaxID=1858653 RepID=UPI002574356E|nr:phosphotransferase family protein [Agromyces mangrovi]